jgi:hypothetical protein
MCDFVSSLFRLAIIFINSSLAVPPFALLLYASFKLCLNPFAFPVLTYHFDLLPSCILPALLSTEYSVDLCKPNSQSHSHKTRDRKSQAPINLLILKNLGYIPLRAAQEAYRKVGDQKGKVAQEKKRVEAELKRGIKKHRKKLLAVKLGIEEKRV